MASTKLEFTMLGSVPIQLSRVGGTSWGFNRYQEKVLGHPASSLLDTLRDRKLIEEEYD